MTLPTCMRLFLIGALHGSWAVGLGLRRLTFTKSRCRPYKGAGFVWAICLHDRLIGTLGVTGGNLGYNLHPDHHGKGIISRATHHAVTQAFETLAHDTLTAGTWHDNAGSARVLRKLGFVHWQTRYTHARARNAPTLLHEHRLTRAAWDGLRTGSQ